MKSKNSVVTYRIVTTLFVLLMLADGLAGTFRVPGAIEALRNLGYPDYMSTIVGVAKVSGGIALLQPYFETIKEWAYAGFVFIFIGAFASHLFNGSSFIFLFIPVLMLGIVFLSYFLRRKIKSGKIATV